MNDKDKEAFEEWKGHYLSCDAPIRIQDYCERVWQAVCEYKNKEFLSGSILKALNDKYENEVERSKILVEALEKLSLYVSHNGDTWVKERATKALKNYRGKI